MEREGTRFSLVLCPALLQSCRNTEGKQSQHPLLNTESFLPLQRGGKNRICASFYKPLRYAVAKRYKHKSCFKQSGRCKDVSMPTSYAELPAVCLL